MTELGVHSIGEFVLAVPALTEAEHFYKSFGLVVTSEGNHLALRAAEGDRRWGRVIEAKSKFLHHITFHCFEDDLVRFKSRLETSSVRLLDAPREFASDGLWFRGHDGILMEIRVGPKTSPDKLWVPKPPCYEAGVRNAPYRLLAENIHIRRFSHMLLFTTDIDRAIDFYSNVLGLRLADRTADAIAFLYAIHGSDHHMVAFAKSDRPGLHHTSWEVPSIDEVGLGAMRMADQGYRRSWGTGRHVLGSNYFHYIRDPWGSWCEYTCGIDFIPACTPWTAGDHPLEDGLYLWGPDLPPDFVLNFEGAPPETLGASLANEMSGALILDRKSVV